ncbi:Putative E3 ubiquitin-protein ligase LIN-1 [Gossypium arboreum]|uniref:Putative E3 ubiquitin-protein ligase LIN-1 n=1 Tax=Gossypium arboreum TaxID=29729 RepID=A0A0B0MI64_GOSAR|nr:Putative E3 ubiquitin-protein ligase LIN-1 [Gossypium arboreum]
MASSLHQLLKEEGFEKDKLLKNQPDDSTALPIYICHGRKSSEITEHKDEKTVIRNGSSVFSSFKPKSDEPVIDEAAIKAVISILGGYTGRYLKDESYRAMVKDKCTSCLLSRRKAGSDGGIFMNMELGIESIDKLVEDRGNKKELRMKLLRNSIRLLSIVASLNCEKSRNGSTCGVPHSHLSACAQLYLSIVYKLEKNHRLSARHLLQVWYHKELEHLSNLGNALKETKMKALSKLYNDQMDMGTAMFAMYYKEWLKIGAKVPPVPTVPLPSSSSYGSSRRRSSESHASVSSINRNLYQTVFGATTEWQSMELDRRIRTSIDICRLEAEENEFKYENYNQNKKKIHRRSSSSHIHNTPKTELLPETQKSSHFRFFSCQSRPKGCLVNGKIDVRNNSMRKLEHLDLPLSDLSKAIATICSSDVLSDCEIAIRVMTKAWLDSHGDSTIEAALTKAPIIEGVLEVLFASNDDAVMELAILILAEFITRSKVNRQIILNSDPQLEIFLKLLKNSSLFLKAAVLLYLLRPKANQMISTEWIPLSLRVLEFGEHLQTLYTIRCSPQVAALYFLDQLLTGFNEDRNLENACQVVSLGGLNLLMRNVEFGGVLERNKAALIISCCIRADGSCRHYVADKLNKAALIELMVGNCKDSNGSVIALLTELLCLNRRTQMMKFLNELLRGWGGLNAMHILLACLHKALPEERPLVAALLLQLDLLGDPFRCSVYREEAVEVIIETLDCEKCNEKIQQQSAKALTMLGGRFSYMGEATTESWLLKQAGFHENLEDSFQKKEIGDNFLDEGEEEIENWQKKAAIALLNSGNKRFLAALSNSMAKDIPSLARASLVTIAWMSCFMHLAGDKDFQAMASSILTPRLLESSNPNRVLEERVLATFSLQQIRKSSEYIA